MSFQCQKCGNRITVDESLINANTAQINLLENGAKSNVSVESSDSLDPSQFITKERLDNYNEVEDTDPVIVYKDEFEDGCDGEGDNDNEYKDNEYKDNECKPNNHKPNNHKPNHQSFVMVDNEEPSGISTRIKVLSQIFEIMSQNHQVDHPICEECAEILVENYKLKFDQSQKEKEYYMQFLKRLKELGTNNDSEEKEVDRKLALSIEELNRLRGVESTKVSELRELEHTKDKLDVQLEEVKQEYEQLQSQELHQLLEIKNGLVVEMSGNLSRLHQIKTNYQHNLNKLDGLRLINMSRAMFDISVDDKSRCGTINGFRLGYKVPWSEINSALGQVVLMLTFVIRRLNMKLNGWRLIAMGSQSQIIKIREDGKKTVMNLYSTNEFSLGKLFNFNKFDVSMIGLMGVLAQIEERMKREDEDMGFPYEISPEMDKVGGKSIRVTSNGEWTEGCKNVLTDLRWCLEGAKEV